MARSLELAQQQSMSYQTPSTCGATVEPELQDESSETDKSLLSAASAKCFFCRFGRHPRSKCPAREAECKGCGKIGHFQRVCKSKQTKKTVSSIGTTLFGSLTAAAGPIGLERAMVSITVNGKPIKALIDTGSSESYICDKIPYKEKWKVKKSKTMINMASTSLTNMTKGHINAQVNYKDSIYKKIKLSLLPDLCADTILGHDFLRLHETLVMPFQGNKAPFSVCSSVCGVVAANDEAPSLFKNLLRTANPLPLSQDGKHQTMRSSLMVR